MSTDADAFVDGLLAGEVISPQNLDELSTAVRDTTQKGQHLVASGAGTKLDWGAPPRALDVLVRLSSMHQVLEHNPGDLVARVQAGLSLGELQSRLAESGQRVALDEVVPGTTVGGLVATALSGPMRHLYGGVRDLLIGLTIVRADGTIARTGSRVTKNVAGYDLCKLFTGSFGTLGIIADATFRLHPLVRSSRYVIANLADAKEAERVLRHLYASQLVASAIEIDLVAGGPAVELAMQFEGEPASVERRATTAAEFSGEHTRIDSAPPLWWGELPSGTLAKLSIPISRVSGLFEALGRPHELDSAFTTLRGSAGLGLIYAGLLDSTPLEDRVRAITQLRELCGQFGGTLVVLRAPRELKDRIDVWGPVRGLELMRSIKANLDPEQRLSPGRFVGGI